MHFISKMALKDGPLFGVGAQLGSSLTVEMIGIAGFDFAWIDCEHGMGDTGDLLRQLQAAGIAGMPAVVRIRDNDPNLVKQVLDQGAAGLMVPLVNTADEAVGFAQAMRYPPTGTRGVSMAGRCHAYGAEAEAYHAQANDSLLAVVQIEKEEALANCREIAAVEGVDVLFVGPFDLTTDMGIPRQFNHPRFIGALEKVASAAAEHGKAAGLLVTDLDRLDEFIGMGFTFLVVGIDTMLLTRTLRELRDRCGLAQPDPPAAE